MNVVVNGESREIPEGLSVATLLDHLKMKRDRVAIERNREIVPRAQWNETQVQPNDTFEIVHFVGGGSDPKRIRVPSAVEGSGRSGSKDHEKLSHKQSLGGRSFSSDIQTPGKTGL